MVGLDDDQMDVHKLKVMGFRHTSNKYAKKIRHVN